MYGDWRCVRSVAPWNSRVRAGRARSCIPALPARAGEGQIRAAPGSRPRQTHRARSAARTDAEKVRQMARRNPPQRGPRRSPFARRPASPDAHPLAHRQTARARSHRPAPQPPGNHRATALAPEDECVPDAAGQTTRSRTPLSFRCVSIRSGGESAHLAKRLVPIDLPRDLFRQEESKRQFYHAGSRHRGARGERRMKPVA